MSRRAGLLPRSADVGESFRFPAVMVQSWSWSVSSAPSLAAPTRRRETEDMGEEDEEDT